MLGAVVTLTRCTFPQRTFDDVEFQRLSAGGSGLAGASGAGGESTGGSGGEGGAMAGAAGEAGQSGEAGEAGAAGVAGEAGSAGSAGVSGGSGGSAGVGGDAGTGGQPGGSAGVGGAGAAGEAGMSGQGGAGGGCVDEGKTLTCGQGECLRTTPACVGGVTQVCEPGKPTLDTCGDGLDNNCNNKVDEYCGAACQHDPCTSAGKLKNDCDPCVGAICETAQFANCCAGSWGPDCIAAVAVVCQVAICKFQCVHGLCEQGAPLKSNCDKPSAAGQSCVAKICAEEPSCCNEIWNQICVDKVNTTCQLGCSL